MHKVDIPDLSSSGISFGENSFALTYSVQSSSEREVLIGWIDAYDLSCYIENKSQCIKEESDSDGCSIF